MNQFLCSHVVWASLASITACIHLGMLLIRFLQTSFVLSLIPPSLTPKLMCHLSHAISGPLRPCLANWIYPLKGGPSTSTASTTHPARSCASLSGIFGAQVPFMYYRIVWKYKNFIYNLHCPVSCHTQHARGPLHGGTFDGEASPMPYRVMWILMDFYCIVYAVLRVWASTVSTGRPQRPHHNPARSRAPPSGIFGVQVSFMYYRIVWKYRNFIYNLRRPVSCYTQHGHGPLRAGDFWWGGSSYAL